MTSDGRSADHVLLEYGLLNKKTLNERLTSYIVGHTFGCGDMEGSRHGLKNAFILCLHDERVLQ